MHQILVLTGVAEGTVGNLAIFSGLSLGLGNVLCTLHVPLLLLDAEADRVILKILFVATEAGLEDIGIVMKLLNLGVN